MAREFISRTRYAIVADEAEADATLRGAVLGFFAFPQNLDPVTGRATMVTTLTTVRLTLWDRAGRVLYDNPRLENRERYEVSADPEAYVEERQAALERASQSMARTAVSAILEMF